LRTLRLNIKKIVELNNLPEYSITMKDDVVMFSRKEPPKENNAQVQSPKHISKAEVEKNARPGESYEQVAERLKKPRIKPGETFAQEMTRKRSLTGLNASLY